MSHWLLVLSLVVCAATSQAAKCKLRVQGYHPSDATQYGFIEVNGNYTLSWSGSPASTSDFQLLGTVFSVVSANCRVLSYLNMVPHDDVDAYLDAVTTQLALAPRGSYIVGATTQSDLLDDKIADFWQQIAAYDYSEFYYHYYATNIELEDVDWTSVFILPKASMDPTEKGILKQIAAGFGPREVFHEFDIPQGGGECVTPMPSATIFNQRPFGNGDGFDNDATTPLDGKSYVDLTNRISCDGVIYGWEYKPRVSSLDEQPEVTFTTWRDGLGSFVKSSTSSSVFISHASAYTETERSEYVCTRGNPVHVNKGDWFGFSSFTDTASVTPIAFAYTAAPEIVDRYPCSEINTLATTGFVGYMEDWAEDLSASITSNVDGDGFDFVFFGHIALRPILDENFMYTCSCPNTEYCTGRGDNNLICFEGDCICQPGYTYFQEYKKCVHTATDEIYRSAYTYNTGASYGLGSAIASNAVDENDSADLFMGTCARTYDPNISENGPFMVIDLGQIFTIYGLTIKTPAIIDVRIHLYDEATPLDLFVYDFATPDISALGLAQVDVIILYGPYPLKIWADQAYSGATDSTVLNREHTNGKHVYPAAVLGSLSTSTLSMRIIEIFGFIFLGPYCWTTDGIFIFLTLNYFVCTEFYVEEVGTTGTYYIRRLSDDQALKFNAIVDFEFAYLASDSTTVTFGDEDFLSGFGSATINLAQDNSFAVGVSEDDLRLRLASVDSAPSWEMYRTIPDFFPHYDYYPATSETPVTLTDDSHFCVEVDSVNRDFYMYGTLTSIDYDGSDYQLSLDAFEYTDDGFYELDASTPDLVGRTSDPGVYDFKVGVIDEFSYELTNPYDQILANWDICTAYVGAAPNGKQFHMQCSQPVEGRYVLIESAKDTARGTTQELHICDIDVHVLNTASLYGYVCDEDSDCVDPECDQHLLCHPESLRCLCQTGWKYYQPANLCVDFDECTDEYNICDDGDESVDGQVDGTCVNTLGSFHCDCYEGYKWTGISCTDINECNIDNGGCEYMCTNLYMDRDEEKYMCECGEGYKLAPDRHSCVDLNECEEYGVGLNMNVCAEYFGMASDCSPDATYCGELSAGICVNTVGSYDCMCPEGYQPEEANICININECKYTADYELGPSHGCEDTCLDAVPFLDEGLKYVCGCENHPGYKLSDNMESCMDIDECTDAAFLHDCGDGSVNTVAGATVDMKGECENHAGYFVCICPDGYRWDEVNSYCYDLDECANNMHECEHECNNEFGTYSCACMEGYQLELNMHSCRDIDECDPAQRAANGITIECENGFEFLDGVEDGFCVNNIGSYSCDCEYGFFWNPFATHCENIDECVSYNGGCEDVCEDRYMDRDLMDYECLCTHPGMKVSQDGETCIDIDECTEIDADTGEIYAECMRGTDNAPESGEIMVQAMCVNNIGSFVCHCEHGYVWNETDSTCHDIDECMDMSDKCEHTCNNLYGGYACKCNDGFRLQADQLACQDIDECKEDTDSCDQMCHNELGFYTCSCNHGYTLNIDAHMCDDANECDDMNGGCEQECVNSVGSYECDCRYGYFLLANEHSCDDKDECLDDEDTCDQICVNTNSRVNARGYYCDCEPGYYLASDGDTCLDLNECTEAENYGGCSHDCINDVGSYECRCQSGYYLSENKRDCIDFDECIITNGGCSQLCINSPGTFECSCSYGYEFDEENNCVGPDALLLRMWLDMEFMERLGDVTSTEYAQLKADIEAELTALLVSDDRLVDIGVLSYSIQGAFRRGSTSFDVSIQTSMPLAGSEQGYLAYVLIDDLERAGNRLRIGDTVVPFARNAEIVYTTPTGRSFSFEVEEICSLFDSTNYCNGGNCDISDGYPVCLCPQGFRGDDCSQSSSLGLSSTDIALIVSLCIAFLLILVLMALVLRRYCCRQGSVQPRQELEPEYVVYEDEGYPYNGFTGARKINFPIYGSEYSYGPY